MTRTLHFVIVILVAYLLGQPSFARELIEQKDASVDWVFSLKLASALKVSPLFSLPVRDAFMSNDYGASVFIRARLEPELTLGAVKLVMAYDSNATLTNLAQLTPNLGQFRNTPYRLWPISNTLEDGPFSYFQQLDRLFVATTLGRFDFVVGRQAIGLGRGLIFSAVDIFAPFSPLQFDQEWRVGIDAVNIDWRFLDEISVQAIATGATNFDEASILGRLRGVIGDSDLEILVAKRALDFMLGLSASLPIADLSLHSEFAVFKTPSTTLNSGIFGKSNWVPKFVFGASNNFDLGNGLYTAIEYHYSGFGAGAPSDLATLAINSEFQVRLARGDTTIIGAQVLGFLTRYGIDPCLNLSVSFVQSLIDFSGVFSPAITWDFSDIARLRGSAYVGYGAASANGLPQSQFGANPMSFVIQLAMYD